MNFFSKTLFIFSLLISIIVPQLTLIASDFDHALKKLFDDRRIFTIPLRKLTIGPNDNFHGYKTSNRLFFTRIENLSPHLYTFELKTGKMTPFVDLEGDSSLPSISPSGSKISYISYRSGGQGEICVKNIHSADLNRGECLGGQTSKIIYNLFMDDERILSIERQSQSKNQRAAKLYLTTLKSQPEKIELKGGEWDSLEGLAYDLKNQDLYTLVNLDPKAHTYKLLHYKLFYASNEKPAHPTLKKIEEYNWSNILPGIPGYIYIHKDYLYFTQYLSDTNNDGYIDGNDHGIIFRIELKQLREKKYHIWQLTSRDENCHFPTAFQEDLIVSCAFEGTVDIYQLPLTGMTPSFWNYEILDQAILRSRSYAQRILFTHNLHYYDQKGLTPKDKVTPQIYFSQFLDHLLLKDMDAALFYLHSWTRTSSQNQKSHQFLSKYFKDYIHLWKNLHQGLRQKSIDIWVQESISQFENWKRLYSQHAKWFFSTLEIHFYGLVYKYSNAHPLAKNKWKESWIHFYKNQLPIDTIDEHCMHLMQSLLVQNFQAWTQVKADQEHSQLTLSTLKTLLTYTLKFNPNLQSQDNSQKLWIQRQFSYWLKIWSSMTLNLPPDSLTSITQSLYAFLLQKSSYTTSGSSKNKILYQKFPSEKNEETLQAFLTFFFWAQKSIFHLPTLSDRQAYNLNYAQIIAPIMPLREHLFTRKFLLFSYLWSAYHLSAHHSNTPPALTTAKDKSDATDPQRVADRFLEMMTNFSITMAKPTDIDFYYDYQLLATNLKNLAYNRLQKLPQYAEGLFNSVVRMSDDLESHFQYIQSLWTQNQQAELEAIYKTLLRQGTIKESFHFFEGIHFVQNIISQPIQTDSSSQIKKAISSLEKLPYDPQASLYQHLALGSLYIRLLLVTSTKEHLQYAQKAQYHLHLSADSTWFHPRLRAASYLNLAFLSLKTQNYSSALESIKKVSSIKWPNHQQHLFYLWLRGRINDFNERYSDAEKDYAKALNVIRTQKLNIHSKERMLSQAFINASFLAKNYKKCLEESEKIPIHESSSQFQIGIPILCALKSGIPSSIDKAINTLNHLLASHQSFATHSLGEWTIHQLRIVFIAAHYAMTAYQNKKDFQNAYQWSNHASLILQSILKKPDNKDPKTAYSRKHFLEQDLLLAHYKLLYSFKIHSSQPQYLIESWSHLLLRMGSYLKEESLMLQYPISYSIETLLAYSRLDIFPKAPFKQFEKEKKIIQELIKRHHSQIKDLQKEQEKDREKRGETFIDEDREKQISDLRKQLLTLETLLTYFPSKD